MSFRKRKNNKECWSRYISDHREKFVSTGLPLDLFQNEKTLVWFLSTDEWGNHPLKLSQMTDQEFSVLYDLLDDYYGNGWELISWKAFRAEMRRRRMFL